jgi:hypothetical protein
MLVSIQKHWPLNSTLSWLNYFIKVMFCLSYYLVINDNQGLFSSNFY